MVGFRPSEWVNSTGNNYIYDLQWNFEKTLAYEVMANLDFDVKLTDWLTFASANSYRYINRTRKNYEDPRSRDGAGYNGNLDDKTEQSYRVYSNQLLRFNKLIDKHSISGVLAYEWNSYTFTKNESTVSGFGAGFTVADAAATPRMITGAQEEYAVQSFLANVNYAYDHKYLAQVSFRWDGASNFGVNARYGNFYSLSAGWNVHREDFFTLDFVNQLKLRA
ncbi:MAG: SusC/RagA family protein, partial [Tannerellaceae bacterium]|nr:SusC/RagA family protein [Tannerellaceae bacterium]